VAPTESTVLLRGETGTGKEVIARAIHRLSHRRQQPFVVANCAAIPRELMESEMFGHVRGAFTGAVKNHSGFFKTAGGGTLLLDEIGDLDLDLQSKILRVLEEGSFRKVGSTTSQRCRARIIAATHQPLEELMRRGRFREDLFYRLNVFPIILPPLRERTQDIRDLARHFLTRACEKRSGDTLELAPDALEVLSRHPWHGNLRELRNCLERLAIVATGPGVTAADVQPLLHDRAQPQTPMAAAAAGLDLKEIERQTILAALNLHGGNRTHTATALGIGRRTLQNKLKLYGVAADETAAED
jgi:transcriptional regulator with PAS, ATPase and Fis domain